jgi:glycolate oxidase FAD binding subunit
MSDAVSLAPFRAVLPADAIITTDAVRAFSCDGLTPQCVLLPGDVAALGTCLAAANHAGLSVMVVGNGAGLGLGNAPRQYDVAISTRALKRIVAHEAADMTVTVEAGATLAEVNAALAKARQHLPLDPPLPERTTIGALIATDGSGPLRLAHGKVRDMLLGVTVVLADGTTVKGGGRVVKNVAGYDLMKLFAGSFGTLAAIVEATFKVRPCPEQEALFLLPAADTATGLTLARAILAAPVMPLYVEVLNAAASTAIGASDRALIVVGCGGTAGEIAAQRGRCAELAAPQTMQIYEGIERERRYAALRDWPALWPTQPAPEGQGVGLGAKLSLLPSKLTTVLPQIEQEAAHGNIRCAILSHVGCGIAYVRSDGAEPARVIPLADWLRVTVRQAGGWTVFDRIPTPIKAHIDTWGDVPALALMRGIKQTLDPHRRLSPGRFVGGI